MKEEREERIFDILLLPCLSDARCIFEGLMRQEGRQKWEYDYKGLQCSGPRTSTLGTPIGNNFKRHGEIITVSIMYVGDG